MDPSADAATLARLTALSHELREAQKVYDLIRDDLKEARGQLADAKKALLDFAAGQGAPMPLFDGPTRSVLDPDPAPAPLADEIKVFGEKFSTFIEGYRPDPSKFPSPVPGKPVTRRECEECNHEIPFDDAPCPDCRGLRFRIVDLDTGKVIQRGRINPPKKPARKPPQPRPGPLASPGG